MPHHLLGVLKPTDNWDIRYYQSKALPIIEEISSRGKLPVLVGGTMYYVQSLLWKDQIIAGLDDIHGSPEDKEAAIVEVHIFLLCLKNAIVSYIYM